MNFTDLELEVMRRATRRSTGGIDLFWRYWSAPIGASQEQAREDLIGIPSDEYNPPLLSELGQFVPLSPLPWAADVVHEPYDDWIIVGGVGSGKTLNMVLVAGYYCCMLPNFRYLGGAPVSWQADLSYREFLTYALDYNNASGKKRRIMKFIRQVRSRPYPTIEFINNSTMEFKSMDRDAQGIMTWSGDMATVDQAEDQSMDLETILGNLGTRLRGQVSGRPRLGKLILMANSSYNPVLWEIFDEYEADSHRRALLLTSYDNPYLTKKQLKDMESRFRDKDEADRLMRSARPLPKGKEFTQELILHAQSSELDDQMRSGLEDHLDGYVQEDSANAGVVSWALPPQKEHLYIMAGDPGQGNPPYRNSPPVLVFDVTGFPQRPATLAAFEWVYGYGSYWPFINTMDRLYELYHPYMAAFDATGVQKAFDDLGVLDQTKLWMPLDFAALKMHMVLCLKVLMGRGLVKLPKSLYSVWNQLLMWQMPDKGLRQDIASAMFMIGYLLNQVLPQRLVAEDEDLPRQPEVVEDRWGRSRLMASRETMRSLG